MPKMAFGLDGSYKHTKSNCSKMLAWNIVEDVEEGDAVIIGECFALMPAGGWERVKAADLIH